MQTKFTRCALSGGFTCEEFGFLPIDPCIIILLCLVQAAVSEGYGLRFDSGRFLASGGGVAVVFYVVALAWIILVTFSVVSSK